MLYYEYGLYELLYLHGKKKKSIIITVIITIMLYCSSVATRTASLNAALNGFISKKKQKKKNVDYAYDDVKKKKKLNQ